MSSSPRTRDAPRGTAVSDTSDCDQSEDERAYQRRLRMEEKRRNLHLKGGGRFHEDWLKLSPEEQRHGCSDMVRQEREAEARQKRQEEEQRRLNRIKTRCTVTICSGRNRRQGRLDEVEEYDVLLKLNRPDWRKRCLKQFGLLEHGRPTLVRVVRVMDEGMERRRRRRRNNNGGAQNDNLQGVAVAPAAAHQQQVQQNADHANDDQQNNGDNRSENDTDGELSAEDEEKMSSEEESDDEDVLQARYCSEVIFKDLHCRPCLQKWLDEGVIFPSQVFRSKEGMLDHVPHTSSSTASTSTRSSGSTFNTDNFSMGNGNGNNFADALQALAAEGSSGFDERQQVEENVDVRGEQYYEELGEHVDADDEYEEDGEVLEEDVEMEYEYEESENYDDEAEELLNMEEDEEEDFAMEM
ncbi:unnamed protein product [Amoebophrya sp. A120]|nr:unnamed protein product [Amoebophrya sp. A120]|eukprot:GSA120T00021092001.1